MILKYNKDGTRGGCPCATCSRWMLCLAFANYMASETIANQPYILLAIRDEDKSMVANVFYFILNIV
jgi:hypothetical protein